MHKEHSFTGTIQNCIKFFLNRTGKDNDGDIGGLN